MKKGGKYMSSLTPEKFRPKPKPGEDRKETRHQRGVEDLPPGLATIYKKHRELQTRNLKAQRNGVINAAGRRGGS